MSKVPPRLLSGLGLTLMLIIVGSYLLIPQKSSAETATLAVAANFTATAKALQDAFEAQSNHTVKLSFGSTGKLYTQIINGAPFDAFLAADDVRPAQLIAQQYADPNSEFTYARGRLALYSRSLNLTDDLAILLKRTDSIKKLAIANIKTAPYGTAAQEVLQRLDVYESLQAKLVQGDNIAQTYQFIFTGNANLGFVALAQVINTDNNHYLVVPADYHSPLNQNAVLLARGRDNAAAKEFLRYLKTDGAKKIIADYGYDL